MALPLAVFSDFLRMVDGVSAGVGEKPGLPAGSDVPGAPFADQALRVLQGKGQPPTRDHHFREIGDYLVEASDLFIPRSKTAQSINHLRRDGLA